PLWKRIAVAFGAEEPEIRASGIERRRAETAVAYDGGRDSLTDLEVHVGHQEHGEVIMAVHVDEARCEREARRGDLRRCPFSREIADRLDRAAGDADVCDSRRRAGAVVDRC